MPSGRTIKFTDDALRALTVEREREGKPQIVYFDADQPGLAAVVGATKTAFAAHYRKPGGAVTREVFGAWKGRGGDMSVAEARKETRKLVGKLESKEPTPGEKKRARKLGPSLAEAAGLYIAEMTRNDCRPTSIETVRREIADAERSYLKAWLDRPLAAITVKECRSEHDRIAKQNGPHIANRVMRELRAVWNHVNEEAKAGAIDGLDMLPGNPTSAVKWITKKTKIAPEFTRRVGSPIADDELPAWHTAVMGLATNTRIDGKQRNGARRDYHLIVILTGLRRSDAASLRWEHINMTSEPRASRVWNVAAKRWEKVTLPARCILRPSPKGGADRAFALPLSNEALEVLTRRQNENAGADNGWVFPTVAMISDAEREAKGKPRCYICTDLGIPAHEKGAVIHISEPKEESDVLVSPHRLRDTFCTVLGVLDPPVSPVVTKLLMNHSLDDSDVTQGYQLGTGIEPLRAPMQRVADYLVTHWKPRKPDLRALDGGAAVA